LNTVWLLHVDVGFFFLRYRHYSEPYIPENLRLSDFDGLVVHSHDYRTSDVFDKKTVIVLGGGSSAIDISIEICAVATKVRIQ
jgi:dimethylaniline monooxygenase (N-oxide forming)